jgi:deazaflavin-dependent oxidoreductase (nitroreductase family)
VIPPRAVYRAFWAIHKAIDRMSGGRIGTARASGHRLGTLFLTTTGRTSGQPRRNALYYVEEGPSFVVVGSNAGADTDPAWWLNLQAHPSAVVEVEGQRHAVQAREASIDEHARLWQRFARSGTQFEEYRRNTTRRLPIVILELR